MAVPLDLIILELVCAAVAALFGARFAALISRKQMTLAVCTTVWVTCPNRRAPGKQRHGLRRPAVVSPGSLDWSAADAPHCFACDP